MLRRPALVAARAALSSSRGRTLSALNKKKKDVPLTREEVEAIAERARTDQKIWDTERKIFGGGISLGHPLFFLLAGGAVLLHFANARRDEQLEESEANLERLRRKRTSRPLTPDELTDVISHKKKQLDVWRTKANDDDPAVSQDARERLVKLQQEISELEFQV